MPESQERAVPEGQLGPASFSTPRMWAIDGLKLLAANLIVLHHLSAYGPVSREMAELWPSFMEWLYQDARMVVQVFLVAGGYLAAAGFSRALQRGDRLTWRTVGQRYLRLAAPYWGALVLAVGCAALARLWMVDDAIPAPPTVGQLLAHAFLLHDLLDQEALSAGVWYVAIDFQLFALMALLAWLASRLATSFSWAAAIGVLPLFRGLVIGLTVMSLFFFTLDKNLDHLGPYFFGSYGLGAVVFWVAQTQRPRMWLGLILVMGSLALVLHFRERLVLALVVVIILGLTNTLAVRSLRLNGLVSGIQTLAPVSYALFLVHFPVCLLGNALFVRMGGVEAELGLLAFLLCWSASWAVAWVFYRTLEAPLQAFARRAGAS